MNIYEGRDVSLATKHSILALIWVQKFLADHCGIGAIIKIVGSSDALAEVCVLRVFIVQNWLIWSITTDFFLFLFHFSSKVSGRLSQSDLRCSCTCCTGSIITAFTIAE